MKGNPRVIERLNSRLADELGTINQYMVHAQMCSNRGFKKLQVAIKQSAADEMKHAEKLINRILYLEGTPAIAKPLKIKIGKDIESQLNIDLNDAADAVLAYNRSMKIAEAEGDHGTADVLDSILIEEERHLDWLITQMNQIEQAGLENYLALQIE